MAKKILAVVLAVMMAVSAMAITAFADVEIPLYTQAYDNSGMYWNRYDDVNTNVASFSVSFDIPVYALYGYMTSDYYMDFTLPNSGWITDLQGNINWSIIVNGKEYTLAAGNGSTSTLTNKVYFGMGAHNYTKVGDVEYWTTVPQSMSYGDLTAVKLVASFTIKGGQWDSWKVNIGAIKNDNFHVTFRNSVDDTEVPRSISFMRDWNPTLSEATTSTWYGKFEFATAEWDTSWIGNNWTAAQNQKANLISFDHTLANRQTIINNAQDGAKLVIDTEWPLVGQATYTLWAKKPSSGMESNWWQYSDSRTYVGRYILDGESSKLEFDVPYGVLYDANYGVLVEQFVIFENITLLNSNIMKSYLRFDAGWGDYNINLGPYANQSLGKLKWAWGDEVQYETAANTYKQVRYAAGGITSEQVITDATGAVVANPNWAGVYQGWGDACKQPKNMSDAEKTYTYYTTPGDETTKVEVTTEVIGLNDHANLMPTKATKIALVIPTADEDNKSEVEQPAEGTEQGEEGEEVNETPEVTVPAEDEAPATGNDANPGTGVALAVVPMLVAAAAAVVSKKH